jgi:hypothetical protein
MRPYVGHTVVEDNIKMYYGEIWQTGLAWLRIRLLVCCVNKIRKHGFHVGREFIDSYIL